MAKPHSMYGVLKSAWGWKKHSIAKRVLCDVYMYLRNRVWVRRTLAALCVAVAIVIAVCVCGCCEPADRRPYFAENCVPSRFPEDCTPPLSEYLPVPDGGDPNKNPYPKLCVAARLRPNNYRYVPAFLASWTQMDMKASIFLVTTEEDQNMEQLRSIASFANAFGGKDAVRLLSITKKDVRKLLSFFSRWRIADLHYTDAAIEHLISPSSPEACEYVLAASTDHFYSAYFADHVIPHLRAKADIITFDYVTWQQRPALIRQEPELVDHGLMKCIAADYSERASVPEALVVSADFLKRTRLRISGSQEGMFGMTDPLPFAVRAANLTSKRIIIGQTLLVHQ